LFVLLIVATNASYCYSDYDCRINYACYSDGICHYEGSSSSSDGGGECDESCVIVMIIVMVLLVLCAIVGKSIKSR